MGMVDWLGLVGDGRRGARERERKVERKRRRETILSWSKTKCGVSRVYDLWTRFSQTERRTYELEDMGVDAGRQHPSPRLLDSPEASTRQTSHLRSSSDAFCLTWRIDERRSSRRDTVVLEQERRRRSVSSTRLVLIPQLPRSGHGLTKASLPTSRPKTPTPAQFTTGPAMTPSPPLLWPTKRTHQLAPAHMPASNHCATAEPRSPPRGSRASSGRVAARTSTCV